jgi:hypothetical protein
MSSKSLKRWRSKTDKLYFEKMLKDRCEICGSYDLSPVHHFFRKGTYKHLRYDEDNAITLCNKCHHEIDHGKNKLKFIFRLIWNKGLDWYFHLRKKAEKDMGSGWLTVDWYKSEYKKLNNK